MDGKDLVRGEVLSEKGSDERGHGDGFLNGEVHASAGVHQSRTVIQVRIFRAVAERQRDQLEQPLQAPGERSRLEQRKGEYSGQSGVHWRPRTHLR